MSPSAPRSPASAEPKIAPDPATLSSDHGRRAALLVAVALAAAVLAVFGRAATFDFVTFDDPLHVTENAMVQRGLDVEALSWALTTFEASNWHPVTWISHLVDWQLWGADPSGHHMTNVLLHAAAAVLLFLALRRMTGRLWPPALVAALFALHPLRVESVAWVAERKDVLSGALAMAVLLAWARYAERPSAARYSAVAAFFALGLAAKPMLVTLPLVLLLLDVWPLGRVDASVVVGTAEGRRRFLRLALEKLPLLALSAASSVVTVIAQRNALGTLDELPLAARLGNALVVWVMYLVKSVFPACLAVIYPHPVDSLPVWQPLAAAALLSVATVVVLRQLGRRPWLAVGWLWYVGMLVPVIGLVQVGSHAMADRFTYLPQIGVWIMVAAGLAEVVERWPGVRVRITAVAGVAVLLLALAASAQLEHWRSSESLYRRAIACTEGNWVAHSNLAEVLLDDGRLAEAVDQAQAAITIHPEASGPYLLMGNALMGLGRPEQAAVAFRRAADLIPENAGAHYNLGVALAAGGEVEDAEASYRAALAADPAHEAARINLGVALLQQRKAEAAAEVLCSDSPETTRAPLIAYNCGLALAQLDRHEEAVTRFARAAVLDPRHVPSRRNLGLLLEHLGRRDEAIAALEQAVRLAPGDPGLAQTLDRVRQPSPTPEGSP